MTRLNWIPQPIGEDWDFEPDAVAWVDVAALERSFAAGDQYVGRGGAGCGQAGRYENVGRHIMSGRDIWMPLVSLRENGRIRFTDGRHRFAWVRDHGAAALPVTIDPAKVERLAALFGTKLRVCEVEHAS